MTRFLQPRRIVMIIGLTLMWCALWTDLAAGTVVAGFIVAVGVTSIGVAAPFEGTIRPIPLIRLGLVVAADLVKSTIAVAAEILTPTDYTDESVVAVLLSESCLDHLFFLASAITLTPGTAVIDSDADTGVLYLHILHDSKRQEVIEHVHQIANLIAEALPSTANTGGSR